MNIAEDRLAGVLSDKWWLLLLRGLFAIAFGFMVVFLPVLSLAALVLLFGAYMMADGIAGVWMGVSGRSKGKSRWILLLWGLMGIGIGLIAFLAPGITTLALLVCIAAWAIATGVLELVAAIRLRHEIEGEWLLILGGLASIVFGALLMLQPGTGVRVLLLLVAAYAFVFGGIMVLLAIKARRFGSLARRDAQASLHTG
jgi:uncharacterized membrane protein HdeD (DUF308 family)